MSESLWASESCRFIDLSRPPELRASGYGMHGENPSEQYKLRGLWCVHLYRYAGEAVIAGQKFPIKPGFASIVPPDTELEHRWLHSGSAHLWVHFVLNPSSENRLVVPTMQDLGSQWKSVYDHFERAIALYRAQPRRAEAYLWQVLWTLSDAQVSNTSIPSMHPAVRKTLQSIDTGLAGTFSVAKLAEDCGFSHNHLTRLFQQHTGETVVGYIKRQRMERAHHMLAHSTLSVKAIASQVGLPDIHHFNKVVRMTTGLSPRQLRKKYDGSSDNRNGGRYGQVTLPLA